MRPRLLAFLLLTLPSTSTAQWPGELPLKHAGGTTAPGITAADLMTRVYLYADDSMMGRAVGTIYNVKATAYIGSELQRLGLQPAGENGTFFQELPLGTRHLDSTSTLTVSGQTLRAGTDFLATSQGTPRQLRNAQVVFGGMALDTVGLPAPGAWDGKVVLLTRFTPTPGFNFQEFQGSAGFRRYMALMDGATVVNVAGDTFTTTQVRNALAGTNVSYLQPGNGSLSLTVTTGGAALLLGRPLADARRGQAGQRVSSDIRIRETRQALGRNVVGIIPGSDPALRGQYVAIGAHNDHIGFSQRPVDHDSVRFFNRIVRPQGADSPTRPATDGEKEMVQALLDSVRQVQPPRLDSIFNGADDDGSGSMGLLELAEAIANAPEKPRRSLLFVWHTGEERGLWGADYFTAHPTVSRDSIVAQLNMDMIGRGAPEDISGSNMWNEPLHGDDHYLQVVGSRRLSTQLGDIIDAVNGIRSRPFRLDYAMDANGHPQNIYCRSDHYEYAKFGIPIAFFTTGGHSDYHQVTDEAQYIRYDHMAEVVRFIHDVAYRVGNLEHRPVVDHPVPDPKLGCRQ